MGYIGELLQSKLFSVLYDTVLPFRGGGVKIKKSLLEKISTRVLKKNFLDIYTLKVYIYVEIRSMEMLIILLL